MALLSQQRLYSQIVCFDRATLSQIDAASALWSPFLFSFDSEANSRKQFLHMTWPGFAATALYLVVYGLLLPAGVLWGDIAWAAAVFLAGLTLVIEGPIAVWTLFRRTPPPVEIPFLGNNPVLQQVNDLWRRLRDPSPR